MKNKKERKLKSIRHKLIVAFLLVIVTVILLIWIMQGIFLKPSYEWFRNRQIHYAIEEIKSAITNGTEDERIKELATENDCTIYIYDNNLNNIYTSDESINSQPKGIIKTINDVLSQLNSGIIVDRNISMNKTEIQYNLYGESIDNHYIIILSKLAPVEATTKVIISQLKIISVIAILISIGIAIILAKKIAKPIQETSEKAKELSNNNFDVKFNHYESIEMQELSDTLNKATYELKEKDRIKKELIANVSHDLKTPLSIIKGYCEMIQDITGEDKTKRDEQLEKIKKETDNLTLMINDMLDLSKIETNNDLKIEKFDISKLINEVLDRLKTIIEKEKIIIEYNIVECEVEADRSKIGQVLYNLITNAINFVGDDNKVIISQIEEKDEIKIEVIDHGIGIGKDSLPYIFDRYYKTNDKYRKTGISTGLGLSIVKAILEKHHFSYGVESEKGVGTKIWFKIKKYHIDIT